MGKGGPLFLLVLGFFKLFYVWLVLLDLGLVAFAWFELRLVSFVFV
jgi:hypothetical protein